MTEADKPHEHDDAADAAPEAQPSPAPTEAAAAEPEAQAPSHGEDAHAESASPAPEAEAHPAEATPEHAAEEPAAASDAAPEISAETASEPTPAPEPAADPEPAPVRLKTIEPLGAAALAGGATAAAGGGGRPPVWSDHGDARDPDDEPAPRKGRKKGKSGGNEFAEILKTVVFALLIAVVLRILLFQPFTIPSASMEPNLYKGDYIVVSKWSYGYSRHSIPFSPPLFEGRIFGKAPERGDVAVFKFPPDDKTDYIKRVIGLPGDRVQMIDGTLHINGQPVRDAPVDGNQVAASFAGRAVTQYRETLPNGKSFMIQDFGPGGQLDSTREVLVPEGHSFMMGDNRDNSVDSRDESSIGVGLVPEENLIGKAEIILFSWNDGASLFNPISWFTKVRLSRFFTDLD